MVSRRKVIRRTSAVSRAAAAAAAADRHHGGDSTAVSSTLSSKFILTSVILPSVSGHSPRTGGVPAESRHGHVSRLIATTTTTTIQHQHQQQQQQQQRQQLSDVRVTIQSTPSRSTRRRMQSTRITGRRQQRADECGQASRRPSVRPSLHVI